MNRQLLGVFLAVCLAANTAACPAAAPPPSEAAPIVLTQGTIATGTPVLVRAKDVIRSGRVKTGDRVDLEVAAAVQSADGTVLIPVGTPVTGIISKATRAKAFGRPGRLELTVDAVQLPGGMVIPLRPRGVLQRSGTRRTGGSAAGGLLLGLGAGVAVTAISFSTGDDFKTDNNAAVAAGVGVAVLAAALIRGREAKIKPGETFQVEVARDTEAALMRPFHRGNPPQILGHQLCPLAGLD